MNRSLGTAAALLVMAAGALAPNPASAQSIWLPRDVDGSVTLEFLKPDFDYEPDIFFPPPGGEEDEDFMTGAAFLTARLPLSPKLWFVGQIPYARYYGPESFGQTDRALGNVYVGLEERTSRPLFAELGVYLPTSSGNAPNAIVTGIVSDVARWEAFYDNAVSVQGALHYRRVSPSHFMVGLRVGPAVLFPTTGGGDPEVMGNYSGRIGYEGRLIRAGAGLTGRILVTQDSLTGSERTDHQVEVHADVGSGSVRPGIELKIPLGDLGEFVPMVLGASVTLVL